MRERNIFLLWCALLAVSSPVTAAVISGGDYEIYADVTSANSQPELTGGTYSLLNVVGEGGGVSDYSAGQYSISAGYIPASLTATSFLVSGYSQETSGSGRVALGIDVVDGSGAKAEARIQWSATQAGAYSACLLVPNSATATKEDTLGPPSVGTGSYQLGAEPGRQIMTGFVANSVGFTWDTKGTTGFPPDADGIFWMEITINNGDSLSTDGGSLVVDNKPPTGLGNFAGAAAGDTSAGLSWSRVHDSHWTEGGGVAHYEIWYGQNVGDVESRSGSAKKWDGSHDPNLRRITTTSTTIPSLAPGMTYYFKIWAIDDFGNSSTVDPISILTAKDSDHDRLSDWEEITLYHTDPYNRDTDGDGFIDGAEVEAGSDPLDPKSVPETYTVVANSLSNTVSFISPTGGLMTTVSVGYKPYQVALVPGGFHAYVTNYGDNTVSVIDIMAEKVVATIPVGINPVGACVSEDGTRCYVTNSTSDDVSIIDCASNTVIKTVKIGSGPQDIKVSADGRRAYVVSSSNNNLSVLDLETMEEIGQIGVGNNPLRIALAPAAAEGKELVNNSYGYVTNSFSDSVSVVNLETSAVEKEIAVGGAPVGVALSSDGAYAYVANNGSGTVSVIDAAGGNVLAQIPVGNDPWDVALTMDDAFGLVTNTADNNVAVFNLRSLQILTKVSVGNAPRGIGAQMAAIIVRPTPTPTPSMPVSLRLWANKDVYGEADDIVLCYELTLNVDPSMVQGQSADAYLALELPDGQLLFCASGQRFHRNPVPILRYPRKTPPDEGIAAIFPKPRSRRQRAEGVAVRSATVPYGSPGRYTWYAILVPSKASPLKSSNWIYSNLASATFRIAR
ncbi:MAG: beta-propeller fold lactonase family protein [Candidatus Aureabacteria bacterium]|nr:beta-propeller fold lactonase family protein [Candidatus Auribacterota bacterium]